MQYKQLSTGPEQVYAVVFEEDDEFPRGLQEFAHRELLTAAQFVAIGAFREAELAWFHPGENKYEKRRFEEQLEVLSLVGNIADDSGKPKIHAHVVLGRRDMTTIGGHLVQARIRPTLEVIVTEAPLHLHRIHDPKTGLALIRPNVSDLPPRRGRDADAGLHAAPKRAASDDGEGASPNGGQDHATEGVGLGMGFAIHKPEGATDWKRCPNCKLWIHGLDRPSCPNCGHLFAESAIA